MGNVEKESLIKVITSLKDQSFELYKTSIGRLDWAILILSSAFLFQILKHPNFYSEYNPLQSTAELLCALIIINLSSIAFSIFKTKMDISTYDEIIFEIECSENESQLFKAMNKIPSHRNKKFFTMIEYSLYILRYPLQICLLGACFLSIFLNIDYIN